MGWRGWRGWRPAVCAATSMATLLGAGALADGVVIESSSSAHAVGDRVAVDSFIAIEDGAQVAVLDRSGAVQRYDQSTRYQVPPAPASARGAGRTSPSERLALSVTGLGRRAVLGSTRGLRESACTSTPGSRSIPSPACAAEQAAAEEDDAGEGEAWGFSVQSELDGFITCDYAEPGGAWLRVPLTEDGAAAQVSAGRRYALSSADGWPNDEDEALVVRCQAVDQQTWDALSPHWSDEYDADAARALMQTLAAVRGGTFVEAAVEE